MMNGRRLCIYRARREGLQGCGVSINGAGYGVVRYNTMIEDKVDSAESSRGGDDERSRLPTTYSTSLINQIN